MKFEYSYFFSNIETIASGHSIREVKRLKKTYGIGHWKKKKGTAIIKVGRNSGKAELHWYEAHGIGKKEFKIKKLLD